MRTDRRSRAPCAVCSVAALLALLVGAGCYSETQCRRSGDPMESEQCVSSGGGPEAIGTAAAAAITWSAVGCSVNGCRPPFHCNDVTGLCERMRCGEGLSCLEPFHCNMDRHVCE